MADVTTQREYCEAMEGMYATAGWRKFWKPKLQELRDSAIENMLYNQFIRLEEVLGCQREVQALNTLLSFEDSVRQLRAHLVESPEDGALVVQSLDKDPEIEAVIGPTV